MAKKPAPLEISLTEAAQLLCCAERTVRNYIKSNKIVARKSGPVCFVDHESLTAWLPSPAVEKVERMENGTMESGKAESSDSETALDELSGHPSQEASSLHA